MNALRLPNSWSIVVYKSQSHQQKYSNFQLLVVQINKLADPKGCDEIICTLALIYYIKTFEILNIKSWKLLDQLVI